MPGGTFRDNDLRGGIKVFPTGPDVGLERLRAMRLLVAEIVRMVRDGNRLANVFRDIRLSLRNGEIPLLTEDDVPLLYAEAERIIASGEDVEEETLEDGSTRTVLRLPSVLAPTKAAVLPLVKKDGLPEIAKEIMEELKWDFNVAYDEKDAVGRRYRRQDALGTPFCITVDHQTVEDKTVTIRHRDTMLQERVAISDLKKIIDKEVSVRNWLMKM
jgi:hypothetical protein